MCMKFYLYKFEVGSQQEWNKTKIILCSVLATVPNATAIINLELIKIWKHFILEHFHKIVLFIYLKLNFCNLPWYFEKYS